METTTMSTIPNRTAMRKMIGATRKKTPRERAGTQAQKRTRRVAAKPETAQRSPGTADRLMAAEGPAGDEA